MKSLPAKIINVYLLVLGCTMPPTLRFSEIPSASTTWSSILTKWKRPSNISQTLPPAQAHSNWSLIPTSHSFIPNTCGAAGCWYAVGCWYTGGCWYGTACALTIGVLASPQGLGNRYGIGKQTLKLNFYMHELKNQYKFMYIHMRMGCKGLLEL